MRRNGRREWWRAKRADAAALACIVLFFVAFFPQVIFGDRFIIAGDAFYYSYPLRTVAWQSLRHGELPLWTPYVLSGYPLLSMAQLALGYPLTWSYLFLPAHWAEQIYVLAPFLLSPMFTYAYARELGRSRLASLLAGLAFGYGGMMTGLLGVIGIPTNALMWFPLVLIAVERVRARRFGACLIGATLAYAMSVLTGYGQGFLFVAIPSLAYAAFLSLFERSIDRGKAHTPLTLGRWRPLALCAGAVALGAGVGAFQVLETLRAARRSIRATLIYPFFVSGSFAPLMALKSLVAPLYTERFADVTTYVPPLALLLVTFVCITAVRGRKSALQGDLRVLFWLGTGLIACVLILGKYTPVYPLLYRIPVLNLFQTPSRHAFEWTFAASVLAAYGWDGIRAHVTLRGGGVLQGRARAFGIAACALLVLSIAIAAVWTRSTGITGYFALSGGEGVPRAWTMGAWYVGLALPAYLAWKVTFTAATLAALWCALQMSATSGRETVLAATLMLVCFVEPFITSRNWWPPFVKTSARLHTPAPATRWLREHVPTGTRVYPRVERFADEFNTRPRVDAPNLMSLYEIESVTGYEPLILERYSRALGNVYLDAVTPLPGYAATNELFEPRSHVLDLLAARYVVTYDHGAGETGATVGREWIEFAAAELAIELHRGEVFTLAGARDVESDTLALVTSLSQSVNVGDGIKVGHARVFTTDGRTVEFDVRTGLDTAEWAHERRDVRAEVRHKLASVFDSTTVNEAGYRYPAFRYWTRLPLGGRHRVERIEIAGLTDTPLALWKATLYDSAARASYPLARSERDRLTQLDPRRWQKVFDQNDVFIFENTRALPHAWLVAEAESVEGEEALRRIRGEGATEFDPRRTALLEVPPHELPALPGGIIGPDSTARITSYEPNHLVIKTNAATPTELIVSEIFYPGWEATLDGQRIQIHVADYLLRGVALPAGQHIVEMRYTAPAARTGTIISTLTLSILVILGFYSWRRRPVREAA
jgi:hypothetical protein